MKSIILSLAFVLGSLFSRSQSGICLTPASTLTTALQPRSLVTDYFNADAFLDIVVCDLQSNDVRVYMGTGNGTFGSPTTYTMGTNPRVTKGDFNNDGFMDIATANEGSCCSPELAIRLNTGTGAFGPVSSYTAGTLPGLNQPQHLASNDFNNDGAADIAIINGNGAGLSVFLGNGTGTFTPCSNYTLSSAGVYMISDNFNSDGYDDLAISNGSNISVLLGSASGSFTPAGTYTYSGLSGPFFITSGNFNNDPYRDIASVRGVLLGSSSGTFSIAGNYNISGGWGLAAADYDLDGNADLAINSSSNTLIFLPGLGSGNFGAQTAIPSIAFGAEIIRGDFNGDGEQDLAAGDGLGSAVQIYLNNSFLFSASASPSISCNTLASTLTAFSSVNNYTWSVGGNSSSVLVSSSVSTIYSVSSSNTVGCISTKTIAVLINTPILQLIVSSNSICPGAPATISVSGASTYSWNTGSGSASIAVSPSVSTIYTASGTNTTGCISSNTIAITVYSNPIVVITASSLSLCGSGIVTLSASGANTYTWSNGSTASAQNFTPIANTCYTVMGTNVVGCTSSTISCILVYPLPSLSISGPNSVCAGSSANLNVNGANTYTWSNGVTTPSINVLPIANSTYSVIGTDSNGCIGMGVFSLQVNTSCSDVWPGDANSDGIVNGLDVLELGLSYLNSGPVRSGASNSYFSQYCANWTGTVSSGKNKCNADCDGDGVVNNSDTLAIFNNFSLPHSFRPAENKPTHELKLVPEYPNFIIPGQWNMLKVLIADSLSPISLLGLVFDVDYLSSAIETNSVYLNYSSSFLNSDAKNIQFRKTAFSNQKLHVADVKTNNILVSGSGEIARFYFKPKSTLQEGSIINFGISQSVYLQSNGSIGSLSVNTISLTVNSNALYLATQQKISNIKLFPNPASDLFVLSNAGKEVTFYGIYDLTGRKVLEGDFVTQTEVKTLDLSNGVYFLIYECQGQTGTIKLLVNK
ncbi:MAG: FG-GAP-like repeat-containing protein [bacterium]|nr:FG-GAP-like repeat-containing protein [bacterium]